MDPTWYLGPLGDMRSLITPEPGIQINEVRYGGVRQGLSGARTVDITGYRSEYTFEFRHLDREEHLWLEALHLRLVPGPFYLINPLKKNRLTSQASRLLPAVTRTSGVTFTSPYTVERDWPTDVPIPGRSLRLAGWVGTSQVVECDTVKPVPVLDGETLTASVYAKSTVAYPGATLRISWYDANKVFLSNTDTAMSITTGWARYSASPTPPVNAAAAKLSFVFGLPSTNIFLAAPMVEASSVATGWEIGGASPLVHLDQIPTVSDRYPLRHATLTLLEA